MAATSLQHVVLHSVLRLNVRGEGLLDGPAGVIKSSGNANLLQISPAAALTSSAGRSQGFSGYDLIYRHTTAHATRNIRQAYTRVFSGTDAW